MAQYRRMPMNKRTISRIQFFFPLPSASSNAINNQDDGIFYANFIAVNNHQLIAITLNEGAFAHYRIYSAHTSVHGRTREASRVYTIYNPNEIQSLTLNHQIRL